MLFLCTSLSWGQTYTWDPLVDTSITVGSAVVMGTHWLLVEPTLGPDLGRQGLEPPGGIDAVALDRWHPGLAMASDVLLYGGVPLALGAASLARGKTDSAGAAGLVALEACTLTGLLVETMKHAYDRPRPFTWDANPDPAVLEHQSEADATLSFPSGHTAWMGAASFAAASVAHRTTRIPPALLYGGAGALTATMGTLRVLAGRHYPTDVLAGGALGATVGLVVPALHTTDRVQVAVAGNTIVWITRL